MSSIWCWLVMHADLPEGERFKCFQTRDQAREYRRRFGGQMMYVGTDKR